MRLPRRVGDLGSRKSVWVGLMGGLLALPALALAQGGPSLEGAVPSGPAHGPAAIAPVGHTPVAAATAPQAPMPAVNPVEPVAGMISADRVYVRPTPSTQHYQLAQLKKDEAVEIVGQANGWYQIAPPAGVYCLIVKDYVEVAADGKSATVKADYVNVRAGSALNPNRSDVILTIVRKGTVLTVLGTADVGATKFLKIAPPEKTYVFVSSQFVKLAAGKQLVPVKGAATAPGASGMIDIGPGTSEVATTNEAPAATTSSAVAVAVAPEPAMQTKVVTPVPAPAVSFAAGSYEKYNELNKRTVEESRKPVAEQDVGGLLEEWNGLIKTENISPSVKKAGEERVAQLEKVLTWQKAMKDTKVDDAAVAAQRAAVKETYDKAVAAIKLNENTGAYLAEGTLETSTVVVGRYALVNPITRRVVAYIEPSAELALDKLLGQYIGVRGVAETPHDTDVRVIKVLNATLIPAPKLDD